MKYLPLIFILLAGCSVDNPTESNYTETQTDTGTGLILKPSTDMWVSFPEMVTIYLNTEACMGMTAPAPDVEFKSFDKWHLGGAWGLYHPAGLVMVNTDEKDTYAGFPERDKQTDTEVLRHEFIHHILNMNGMQWHDGESTEIFKACGAGVTVSN